MRVHQWMAMLGLAVALVGCGGGGGKAGRTLSVSPHAMSFVAAGDAAADRPPPQVVNLSVSGGKRGKPYFNAVATGTAVQGVLDVTVTGRRTATAQVHVLSPDVLGAGDYSSVVTIRACRTDPTCSKRQFAGSPQTINVTYTVHGVKASVAGLTYAIGDSPASADYTRSFVASGATGDAWTAASSVEWLTVSPSSGTGGTNTTVQATLDPAQVDLLLSGSYPATITLTPSAGHPVVIPVTVGIDRAEVVGVYPYLGTSARSETVIVRGAGFTSRGVTGVRFGNTPATAYSVVDDTELRATYPPLDAGRYPVHVANAAGTDRTLATLVVVDPPTGPPATLEYPQSLPLSLLNLFYDGERHALLAQVDRGNGLFEIVRYVHGPSGWSVATRRNEPALRGMGLNSDGQALIVTYHDSGRDVPIVKRLEPQTLASLGQVEAAHGDIGAFALANDGTLVVLASAGLLGYVDRTRTLRPLDPASLVHAPMSWTVGASADGSRLVLAKRDPQDADNLVEYDSHGGLLAEATAVAASASVRIDRQGTRVLFDGTLTDGHYAQLGAVLPGSLRVLSPDGSRAYVCCVTDDKLHVFDLVAAPVGGAFPEIGTGIPLPATSPTRRFSAMTISPDGGTLFIGSSDLIAVVPVP